MLECLPSNIHRCLEQKQEHPNYIESCQIITEEENDVSRRGRKRTNYILVKHRSAVDEETQRQVCVNAFQQFNWYLIFCDKFLLDLQICKILQITKMIFYFQLSRKIQKKVAFRIPYNSHT